MGKSTIVLPVIALLAAPLAGCSSDPCEDLAGYGEPCADPVVKEFALSLAEADDHNQCRLYRDAWAVTYQPRCDLAAAGWTPDAGTDAGAAPPDGGAADGGMLDVQEVYDAGTADDSGTYVEGSDDAGPLDAAYDDAGTDV